MKVAHLGLKGLPSRTGAERVAEAIVLRLAARQQITVYCDARYVSAGTKVPGVRLVRIPTLGGKHLRPVSLFLLSSLHALLRGDYDVIHLHNVEAAFVLPLLRLRYPAIATAHGSPSHAMRSKWGPVARMLMRLSEYPFLWLSTRATSVSRRDASFFERRYGRKALYVPNGVDVEATAQEAWEASLSEIGLEEGNYVAFAAARIDPTKGCHLLLEAFRRLNLDIPLVIIGDLDQVPRYGAHLRQMANARVTFIPPIAESRRLFAIVQHCRLFVFPSTAEGMSMMLLEAAALGAPLVCSDIEENREVVEGDAVYFRSGDAGDLAAKLRWALEHAEEMQSLAAKAKTRVRREYDWSAIVDRYEALYRECAQRRCGRWISHA